MAGSHWQCLHFVANSMLACALLCSRLVVLHVQRPFTAVSASTAKNRTLCVDEGRGGSCELMIGCIAKAAASELHPDMDEMDDVRWIHKDVVKQAVHVSSQPDHPYLGEPPHVIHALPGATPMHPRKSDGLA